MEQEENCWHGAESCKTLHSCEYAFLPTPFPRPKHTYNAHTYVIGYLGPELKIFTEQG